MNIENKWILNEREYHGLTRHLPAKLAQDIPFCSIFPFYSIFTYTWFGTPTLIWHLVAYSRVPNNSQDLIGVWVRNFYDNLNVNDPIIVHFLTALKSYKWGVLNKSQLNTTYSEKRFLKVTYYIIEWSNHSYIHM